MVSALVWLLAMDARCSRRVARRAVRGWRADQNVSQGVRTDARFPRLARLTKAGDFRSVFALATKSSDPCFTVLARCNSRQPARLGLAISKRNARRAVDRNRLKRVIRESFRHCRYGLHGFDFVVLSRRGALTSSNDELTSSLSKHWERIRDQLCESC